MRYLIAIFGMVCSLYLMKYREKVGDIIGEADWMNKIGGVYNIVIIFSLLLFFWSVAILTDTQDILLKPLIMLLPGVRGTTNNSGASAAPDFYID